MKSPSEQPWRGRRLHLIGVGGAGMSAYARAAAALGAEVSGSDCAETAYGEALCADGVLEPRIGHADANLPDGDDVEVVCSSAIPDDNVEREAALARGLRVIGRGELLGELSALRRTIAVAGAHGKTTTTAMIVTALRGAGLDPGYLLGGTLAAGAPGGEWGSGEWLVVEADESDRSMLDLNVEIAVLTSVELDHHSTFGSLLELQKAYREFLAGAPCAVIWDRPELLALRDGPLVAYDVPAPALEAGGSSFTHDGVDVHLAVPGAHNALNAAAAIEVCRLAGADLKRAASALNEFRGAGRRFERLGTTERGALLIDDYAHHPTEVAATIAAARTLVPQRLIAIFQPHLYSRTERLRREFGEALAGADVAVVLDVYRARERAEDFPGVSGRMIAEATTEAAPGMPVYWLPGFDDAERVLRGMLGDGDVVLAMGAGDVDSLARRLVEVESVG